MDTENAEPIVEATLLENETLLRLVLNRPKGNVLSLEMMQALSKELEAQKNNTHLRAVIIRGAGKHFSFGASVEEHQKEQSSLSCFHDVLVHLFLEFSTYLLLVHPKTKRVIMIALISRNFICLFLIVFYLSDGTA